MNKIFIYSVCDVNSEHKLVVITPLGQPIEIKLPHGEKKLVETASR